LDRKMRNEYEDKMGKEIERRLSDNFLEWEEEYKRKRIDKLREAVKEQVK